MGKASPKTEGLPAGRITLKWGVDFNDAYGIAEAVPQYEAPTFTLSPLVTKVLTIVYMLMYTYAN